MSNCYFLEATHREGVLYQGECSDVSFNQGSCCGGICGSVRGDRRTGECRSARGGIALDPLVLLKAQVAGVAVRERAATPVMVVCSDVRAVSPVEAAARL